MPETLLFFGDNLDILRLHLQDESADLIYLDPPFNSRADYHILDREQDRHIDIARQPRFP